MSVLIAEWGRRVEAIDPLWYGIVAILLGLRGQLLLTPFGWPVRAADTRGAIVWYALATGVFLFGWSTGYRIESLLASDSVESEVAPSSYEGADAPEPPRQRFFAPVSQTRDFPAMGIALALLLNAIAIVVLRGNWYSAVGFWLWVTSLAVFIGAVFVWEKRGTTDRKATSTSRHSNDSVERFPWWFEAAVLTAIVALALIIRLWKLADLSSGMHGDEGEAGFQALGILHGLPTSPFLRGWFGNPNVYFWSVAIVMKIFGTGLFGLRMLAVICGLVTVILVYLLARELFGVRAAIIAGFFIAFQSADALFSRMELSNAPTPALTVASFYFLVRGLKTKSHVYFAFAGIAAAFNAYYYAGGRLTGLVALLFLAYLAIIHRSFLRRYWTQAGTFCLGLVLVYMPFLFSLIAYPIHATDYPNDRFIWLHHSQLASLYGTGSWPAILWDQLRQTLSIITFNSDYSANGMLNYPIARPFEAVLIVLGIAWALWRWRDSRFALISIWFWSTIIAGGVLTIEAPNLPRIVAILPVLPIVIAVLLDALAARIALVIPRYLSLSPGEQADDFDVRVSRLLGSSVGASWIALAAVMSVVLVSGISNWQMYIGYYLNTHQNPVVTGQAEFVCEHGIKYYYYDLGDPNVFWNHGDNKFINYGIPGRDSLNPSVDLPITDNGPRANQSVAFLLWFPMYQYLPVLKAFYPEGKVVPVAEGDHDDPASPLYAYFVTAQQVAMHRRVRATYVGANGLTVTRMEDSIGMFTGKRPPANLAYPVDASWGGSLVIPGRGALLYATGGSVEHPRLVIDRYSFQRRGASVGGGIHSFTFTESLKTANSKGGLIMPGQDGRGFSIDESAPVPKRYLWDGHVPAGWSGSLVPVSFPPPSASASPEPRAPPAGPIPQVAFLGYRNIGKAAGNPYGGAYAGWESNLFIPRTAHYRFGLSSVGFSSIQIDGRTIVQDVGKNPNAPIVERKVLLRAGKHYLLIRYLWRSGVGQLELYWQPPHSPLQLMLTPHSSPHSPRLYP